MKITTMGNTARNASPRLINSSRETFVPSIAYVVWSPPTSTIAGRAINPIVAKKLANTVVHVRRNGFLSSRTGVWPFADSPMDN
ncbi:MAG: hypothetical protein H0U66_13480 [Gemmatimonadaceae bacterium]|nr:hypothetical protein [Gemmatimonadaceae bacterium]